MKRDHVPLVVSGMIGGRPVRWAPTTRLVGDYDGRERTLQVFNAESKDQRMLLDEVDRHRASLEKAAGGPLVIIFHSVSQSAERYGEFVSWFVRWFPRTITAPGEVAPPPDKCVDAADESGPHRRVAAA